MAIAGSTSIYIATSACIGKDPLELFQLQQGALRQHALLTAVPVDDTEPPALEDGLPNVTVGFSEAAIQVTMNEWPWVTFLDITA